MTSLHCDSEMVAVNSISQTYMAMEAAWRTNVLWTHITLFQMINASFLIFSFRRRLGSVSLLSLSNGGLAPMSTYCIDFLMESWPWWRSRYAFLQALMKFLRVCTAWAHGKAFLWLLNSHLSSLSSKDRILQALTTVMVPWELRILGAYHSRKWMGTGSRITNLFWKTLKF